MSKLARFLRRAPTERRLLIEASLLLLLARAVLKLLPFRTILRGLARCQPRAPRDAAASLELVHRVRRAVLAAARNGPGQSVCFPQAIAAHLMLARRGVASTLYYGVAKDEGGRLAAHVWTKAGAIPVTGCAAAPRFTLMTTVPAEARGSVT